MPQPRSLVVMPGSKMRAPDLARHAGAVVDDAQLTRSVRRLRMDGNGAAAALERIDRVLHQRLERPLEQHGIALHRRAGAGGLDPEVDRVGVLGSRGRK